MYFRSPFKTFRWRIMWLHDFQNIRLPTSEWHRPGSSERLDFGRCKGVQVGFTGLRVDEVTGL